MKQTQRKTTVFARQFIARQTIKKFMRIRPPYFKFSRTRQIYNACCFLYRCTFVSHDLMRFIVRPAQGLLPDIVSLEPQWFLKSLSRTIHCPFLLKTCI